jgi:hypothetical protein
MASWENPDPVRDDDEKDAGPFLESRPREFADSAGACILAFTSFLQQSDGPMPRGISMAWINSPCPQAARFSEWRTRTMNRGAQTGEFMLRTTPATAWTALIFWLSAQGLRAGEPPSTVRTDPVVIRLVKPEDLAAQILRLFEGSPAPHPAAALAAWKRASREPDRLGKPTEAVISFFNPEMVREWRAFHDARFQLGIEPRDQGWRWRLSVPHDDGTLAALITVLRLSGSGADAAPADGKPAVEHLGRGDAVALRSGSVVYMASSREELDSLVRSGVKGESPDPRNGREVGERSSSPAGPLDPGLYFRIEPKGLASPTTGSVQLRRLIELIRGLGCERIDGRLGIETDRMGLEIASILDAGTAPSAPGDQGSAIDKQWLSWIPTERAAAVFSIATSPEPKYWDRVFALADRVDRADPARADLAPLRVRLNLLAAASGARLEADLWPHLRGLTLGVLADPARPGRTGSIVLCLHLDAEESAIRVLGELLPGLITLQGGLKTPLGKKNSGRAPEPRVQASPRLLGRLAGRPLEAVQRGSTVVGGWGEGALIAALRAAEQPAASVQSLVFSDPAGDNRGRTERVGLFWPGRLSLPIQGLDGNTPLARCLAEGPPMVWVGWSTGNEAHDRVRWGVLRSQVRRFLAAIPLAHPAAQ